MNVKPEVSTTAYEWAHGKKPRGAGFWAFWIRPYRGAPDSKSELFFAEGAMTYGAAKDQAICRAYDLWAGEVYAYIEVGS